MASSFFSHDFKDTLRAGEFAFPGGYQKYFITSDGAALCFTCGRSEAKLIIGAIRNNLRDGWQVTGVDINWECQDLSCDNCNKPIPASYDPV